jgi:hypothetical protein
MKQADEKVTFTFQKKKFERFMESLIYLPGMFSAWVNGFYFRKYYAEISEENHIFIWIGCGAVGIFLLICYGLLLWFLIKCYSTRRMWVLMGASLFTGIIYYIILLQGVLWDVY